MYITIFVISHSVFYGKYWRTERCFFNATPNGEPQRAAGLNAEPTKTPYKPINVT